MNKQQKPQRDVMSFFKRAAEKSGKPFEEFMQTDGVKMRDKLIENRKLTAQYSNWLRGKL